MTGSTPSSVPLAKGVVNLFRHYVIPMDVSTQPAQTKQNVWPAILEVNAVLAKIALNGCLSQNCEECFHGETETENYLKAADTQ